MVQVTDVRGQAQRKRGAPATSRTATMRRVDLIGSEVVDRATP
jgi:hypothetical protein